MMGVSSSIFISSSLILLNIEPIVIKCTMGFIYFFMSINCFSQFYLIGFWDLKNMILMAIISLIGCFISNIIIKKFIKSNKTNFLNKMISISCLFLLTLVSIIIPLSCYNEYLKNDYFFRFGKLE